MVGLINKVFIYINIYISFFFFSFFHFCANQTSERKNIIIPLSLPLSSPPFYFPSLSPCFCQTLASGFCLFAKNFLLFVSKFFFFLLQIISFIRNHLFFFFCQTFNIKVTKLSFDKQKMPLKRRRKLL